MCIISGENKKRNVASQNLVAMLNETSKNFNLQSCHHRVVLILTNGFKGAFKLQDTVRAARLQDNSPKNLIFFC